MGDRLVINDLIFLAYLLEGDYNVIGVDWSPLVTRDYLTAIKGAYFAAKNVSSLINWLVSSRQVKLENIHLIGHSLGAHVAGLSSDTVTGNGKIGRITGRQEKYEKNLNSLWN